MLFLLLLLAASCFAQDDAAAAIQSICNSYSTGHTLQVSGSMKMYARSNATKIIERMQTSCTIKDKQMICSIGPLLMLINSQYYVSIDHADKIMVIGRKKDVPSMSGQPVVNLAQLKQWVSDKKIQTQLIRNGPWSVLRLADPQGSSGFSLYEIEYSNITGFMKKAILEKTDRNEQESKAMVLEINYSSPVIIASDKNLFSEKVFFNVVNSKVELAAAYKNYQLINQL